MLKKSLPDIIFFEHRNIWNSINFRWCLLPSYLKPFVSFAHKVGWRDEEISGLTWNQVDRDLGIVRLEAGETKKIMMPEPSILMRN